MRVRRGMKQREMWEATGIGRGSYLRLEHAEYDSPPVRPLVNCGIVLGCKLEDFLEPSGGPGRSSVPARHARGIRSGCGSVGAGRGSCRV
jgi:hypothetical protein